MKSSIVTFTLAACLATVAFAQDAAAPPSPITLKAAAREAYQQGQPAKADNTLKELLGIYRNTFSLNQTDKSRRIWFDNIADVAYEYLRGGDVETALTLLGEAADLGVSPWVEFGSRSASACGALNRRLGLMDAEERYELLHKWSMPTESRQNVRVYSSLVPQDAPPEVFARALGERPKSESFLVARLGRVRGMFCTAWALVDSAAEAGRLRQLTVELNGLVEKQLPKADFVLLLAKLRGLRGQPDAELIKAVAEQAEQAKVAAARPIPRPKRIERDFPVIAAAAMSSPALADSAEQIFLAMIEHTYGDDSPRQRPFFRLAQARADCIRKTGSGDILDGPRLKFWVPADITKAESARRGAVPATWLAQEEHLMHVAGSKSRNNVLFFRYPLVGDFEIEYEVQFNNLGGVEAGIEYDGISFLAGGSDSTYTLADADIAHPVTKFSSYVANSRNGSFHRFALRAVDGKMTAITKGHPVWSDPGDNNQSPWVGLHGRDLRPPIYRNFRFTGNPVIPREVRMSAGNELRGWRGQFYDDRLSTTLRTIKDTEPPRDWTIEDGVIHGRKDTPGSGRYSQSVLQYGRPLLDGDSVEYEFFYEAGKTEVHPAIGRVAFLIEPGGVRLHWLTDGASTWTGLPRDNAVIEPFDRRGPRPLPLKESEWNQASIELNRGAMKLSLNGTLIYQRKLNPETTRTFGLYHDRFASAVQVRNAVLRGDWPETVPKEAFQNLLAITDTDRTEPVRHAVNVVFGDENLAANVDAIREHTKSLSADERIRFLSKWILPGKNHPGFRMGGAFTQTYPAPQDLDDHPTTQTRLKAAAETGAVRVEVGGELVSPVYDLVDAAQEAEKLDELRDAVTKIEPEDVAGQRARWTLLGLIGIAKNDAAAARSAFEQLFDAFRESQHSHVHERWPETLALTRGIHYAPIEKINRELVYSHYEHYVRNIRKWRDRANNAWENHLFQLVGMVQMPADQVTPAKFSTPPPLKNWIPVSYTTARTRGEGLAVPHWIYDGERVQKMSGHGHGYLFYRIPMRGDFEVECEVSWYGWHEGCLLVGGVWVDPLYNREAYESGTFRDDRPRTPVEPKLSEPKEWARVRVVVRDGVRTSYFNGRKLNEEKLPLEYDPWIAFRAPSRNHCWVRNVRISHEGDVPEKINLATSSELAGWIPYFEERVGDNWVLENGGFLARAELIGWSNPDLAGSHRESLLCYQRPLLEDGEIEYDFLYEPGKKHTHPALDRLGFLLEPDGVVEHWMTNGRYDRTRSDPANRFVVKEHRRASPLPLKAGEWNHMQLKLRGDVVQLVLNEQLIYERKLEVTNQRIFGVFHYVDRTEARIRNLVWRGDWPKKVPVIADQQLAVPEHECLAGLEGLTEVVTHNFAQGVPEHLLQVQADNRSQTVVRESGGLRLTPPARNGWAPVRLVLPKKYYGDLDITLRFEQLKLNWGREHSIGTDITLVDGTGYEMSSRRCHFSRNRVWASLAQSSPLPNGKRRYTGVSQTDESASGTLRLVRRGKVVHALIAHGDSPYFHHVGSGTLPSAQSSAEIQLRAYNNGGGRTQVVFKEFTIRSNSSAYEKLFDPRAVAVNQYTLALPAKHSHDFRQGMGRYQATGAEASQEGLKLNAAVDDAAVNADRGVTGDFDLATEFTSLELPNSGRLAISVSIPGEESTEGMIALSRTSDGDIKVTATSRQSGSEVGTVTVKTCDGLRMVRVQRSLLFLYCESGFYRVLGQADCGVADVKAESVRVVASGEAAATLTSFESRATKHTQ